MKLTLCSKAFLAVNTVFSLGAMEPWYYITQPPMHTSDTYDLASPLVIRDTNGIPSSIEQLLLQLLKESNHNKEHDRHYLLVDTSDAMLLDALNEYAEKYLLPHLEVSRGYPQSNNTCLLTLRSPTECPENISSTYEKIIDTLLSNMWEMKGIGRFKDYSTDKWEERLPRYVFSKKTTTKGSDRQVDEESLIDLIIAKVQQTDPSLQIRTIYRNDELLLCIPPESYEAACQKLLFDLPRIEELRK